MKKWRGILVICPLLALVAACQKSNNNSPYPQISLKGFAPDTLTAGKSTDTAFIVFDFFDGDADINKSSRIKIIDSRTNDSLFESFPDIPDEVKDPSTGLDGTCRIAIDAPRIRKPQAGIGNVLQFKISIYDNAGHESNTITTPDLYVK